MEENKDEGQDIILHHSCDSKVVKDSINNPNTEKLHCKFHLEGRCRFGNDCNKYHDPSVKVNGNEVSKQRVQDSSSKKHAKCKPKIVKTKPRMRTALDVIHRIQWDNRLPEELITIGYEDRFKGIQEEPFDRFSHWGDLSSVAIGTDENILAIPQHRIHYFKYRNTKIWDRDTRKDFVFGSTENIDDSFSLDDFLEKIDQSYQKELEEKEVELDDDDNDSDDDSDDEFNIKVGEVYDKNELPELELISTSDEDRSTHFIAIKVTNPDIIERAVEIQKNIIEKEEILGECTMKPGLFHITLSMVKINGCKGLDEAKTLMDEIKEEFDRIVKNQSCKLVLNGLDTFGQRVLFAKVIPDPVDIYDSMYSVIQNKLESCVNVSTTNKFQSVPHMTLLKVSRPVARIRNSKYLPSYLYEEFIDKKFGCQPINNLKLCLIDAETGSDGFYQTISTIEF